MKQSNDAVWSKRLFRFWYLKSCITSLCIENEGSARILILVMLLDCLSFLYTVRTYGLRVEGIKQTGSDLGRVCMQFRPLDYRRGRFQIASSGASLSHIDRRTPIMRSIGMSVVCAAASVCLFLCISCSLYMCFMSWYCWT